MRLKVGEEVSPHTWVLGRCDLGETLGSLQHADCKLFETNAEPFRCCQCLVALDVEISPPRESKRVVRFVEQVIAVMCFHSFSCSCLFNVCLRAIRKSEVCTATVCKFKLTVNEVDSALNFQ